MSDLRERIDALSPDVRAIVARWWRAGGLPRVCDLGADQAALADEYVAWWDGPLAPTGPKVELPPPFLTGRAPAVPRLHPEARLHECVAPVALGDGTFRYRSYGRYLVGPEQCRDCGWSPALPLPRLPDVVDAIRYYFGADEAVLWWQAGLELTKERAA